MAKSKTVWNMNVIRAMILSAVAIGLTNTFAVAQGDEPLAPVEISWGVVDNYVGGSSYFESRMTMWNTGPETLGDDWAIYFNFIRRIWSDSLVGPLSIHLLNGSFYEMKPEHGFRLAPGDSISLRIIAANWVIRESAAPYGFYLVPEGGAPMPLQDVRIEPFLTDQQVDRHEGDDWPVATALTRFETNKRVSLLPGGAFSPIIPTPAKMRLGKDSLQIATPIRIRAGKQLSNEADHLAAALQELFGLEAVVVDESETDALISLSISGSISGSMDGSLDDGNSQSCGSGESYTMDVNENEIRIDGSDEAGVFYGVQSLLALVDPDAIGQSGEPVDVPHVAIEDCPRFPYRGIMVDVARYFHPPDRIAKTMRFMASYKLNRFHLHIADDEGWRLPVAGLPELTEIGGRRGHSPDSKDYLPPAFGSGPDPATSAGSGHYSREEFVDLLRFASRHHIKVIPEIDAPGHIRAAIVSMMGRYRRLSAAGLEEEARRYLLTDLDDQSVYRSVQGWDDNVANVCIESTYRFFEVIIDELVGLFAEAGTPLEVVHFGGDEVPSGVWEKSPACKKLIDSSEELVDVGDLSPYFVRRVVGILESRGLMGAGWEEIGFGGWVEGESDPETPEPDLVGKVIPYAWFSVWGWGGEERAYQLANAGYQVVMASASNLYFDLAYEKHPADPGFAWGGFVDTRKIFELTPLDIYNSAYTDLWGRRVDTDNYQDSERLMPEAVGNILGIQGQLWGENTPTRERFEYMMYPKLLGLAERAWVKQPAWSMISDEAERIDPLNQDWNQFANGLGRREFLRLGRMYGGVGYRIPPPGAAVINGKLEANVAYPGLEIRFTTDGSEPDLESPLWIKPVPIPDGAVVRVRAFDQTGRGGRPTTVSAH